MSEMGADWFRIHFCFRRGGPQLVALNLEGIILRAGGWACGVGRFATRTKSDPFTGSAIPRGQGCDGGRSYCGRRNRHVGRGDLPHECNLRRAFCTPHSAFRTWQALQVQGFGGEGAGGGDGAGVFVPQSLMKKPLCPLLVAVGLAWSSV
jgi:hypothetical protein